VDPQAVSEHPVGNRLHAVLPKPVSPSSLLDCLTQLADPGTSSFWRGPERSAPSSVSLSAPADPAVPAQILVVDDNPVNIEVAVRMAETMGYRADAAPGGQEALDLLARRSYELVLMDLQMPEVDGYRATAEIRRREGSEQRTPIVAVTAHAMPEDRERALARGFDDYLAKPIDYDVMLTCLHRWIEPPRAATPAAPAVTSVAPPPDISASPPLDAEVLASLRRLSRPGEEDFAAAVLKKYAAILPELRQALHAALSAEDRQAFARSAHKLKSGSAHVGAQHLARLCASAQTLPSTTEPIHLLGRELLVELDRVAAHIDRLLREAAP
jgi:CheY-like chemotaxis protein